MPENTFDVIVIGSGPGGYVAAIKASQLGMRVACVDERAQLGGTCLNVGCIPSKALLHSTHLYEQTKNTLTGHGILTTGVSVDLTAMMARKNAVVSDLTKGIGYLFRKNNITFLHGTAGFYGPHQIGVLSPGGAQSFYTARYFIIATGSDSLSLPSVTVDEEVIVSSTGALSLTTIPESLIVIGGGYIGLEMASIWNRLGSHVTVIEYLDRLVPQMDHELGDGLEKTLTQQGIVFRKKTKVISATRTGKNVHLIVENTQTATREEGLASCVLVAIGRGARTLGLNLEKAGVQINQSGFITVNSQHQTTTPHIFAIGDVIGGMMLAHKAEEEGIAVAETISGHKGHVNYGVIPAVIYTNPEAASVGMTEQDLIKKSIPYKVGRFPFSANSRARAVGEQEGFVKILADPKTDEIFGVHILHADGGTLIAEAALALEYRASCEDLARTCHAHPSFSEAVKEAALAGYASAIHM